MSSAMTLCGDDSLENVHFFKIRFLLSEIKDRSTLSEIILLPCVWWYDPSRFNICLAWEQHPHHTVYGSEVKSCASNMWATIL